MLHFKLLYIYIYIRICVYNCAAMFRTLPRFALVATSATPRLFSFFRSHVGVTMYYNNNNNLGEEGKEEGRRKREREKNRFSSSVMQHQLV